MSRTTTSLLLLGCILFAVSSASAQPAPKKGKKAKKSVAVICDTVKPVVEAAPSLLEHYMQFAHPVGTAQLEFPGPYGGFTFVHLPTKTVTEYGDTVVKPHVYLIDMNLAHDGVYLAPDTMKTFSEYVPFEFVLGQGRIIHTKLAPNNSRESMLNIDTTFNGAIGYGLLKQFVTVFDFKKNTLTFYPLYANISMAEKDPKTIQLPLLDDAYLTYCHCPYPTIWLDVQAPPFKGDRVQLALQQPISQIFTSALDEKTQAIYDKEAVLDPKTGQRAKVGFAVDKFRLGEENIAARSAHRAVDPLPDAFHDLSVDIVGTLGTDVLRTFSGMIIDPSRSKVILVK